MSLSLLARSLHVLTAIVWIGGMLFIALVLVPVVRRLEPADRLRLVQATGLRFRRVGWIALSLLLLSGLLNLWLRPYLLGVLLFHVKLGLVVLALALSVVHDFVLGPRAGAPGADPALRVRAAWVARANVLVVLAVVVLGLALRG
jgi:putative copper export protein